MKQCDPPTTLCDGQCVDLNIDADHCGSCANACPSGICQGGACVGANVGHVILACMDYSQPVAGSPQTVLLSNAIFLPAHNPVRILAYSQYVPLAVRNKVDRDIDFAASSRARAYSLTPIDNFTGLSANLNVNDFDVFLIYDQSVAPAGQLAKVGMAWRTSTLLTSFAGAGGVIVALSGGGGTGEMPELLSSSQLLDVSAETKVTGTTLYNRVPADALGVNVISPFLGPTNSCTFTTGVLADPDTIFVIRDAMAPALGSPVVVHRVIAP